MISRRPPLRVAVMLRGHKLDDKLLHLRAGLQGPDAAYDLFLLLDETGGAHAITDDNVVRFSLPRCAELGLPYTFKRLFWQCGDVALFFAYRQLPAYSHFIMIDYDVHFVKSGAAMLNAIVGRLRNPEREEIDAIGLQYSLVGPGWPYQAAAKKHFGEVRFFYFPFVALSRRALAYVHAQRRLELLAQGGDKEPVICEAFVPSHLAIAGFHCIDLKDILPGSYESAAPASTMRMFPAGLPLGAPIRVKPGIEMVHPVYSVADHLRRAVERLKTRDAIERFIETLSSDTHSFIDPVLRAECERQLRAKLAGLAA